MEKMCVHDEKYLSRGDCIDNNWIVTTIIKTHVHVCIQQV